MKFSLNLNSDLSVEHFLEAARLAESAGYYRLWVGESIGFGHSFPFITMAAEKTQRILVGAGILSPQLNHCHHICRAFQTLREVCGDRFAVAIAPGDILEVESAGASTQKVVERVLNCIQELRKLRDERKWELPVYVGASGPRLLAEGSLLADGVLINYVNPEFVEWALSKMKCKTFVAAYGPALLRPDGENERFLRAAAFIVLAGANKAFLEEFGLEALANEARENLRKGRISTERLRLSLEKFALAGDLEEIKAKFQELEVLGVNEVILATPICRNLASINALTAI